MSTDAMLSPREFYDALAPEYDRMTGFGARVERETRALAPLVERFGIRSAVDTGCGTGTQTTALARLGVRTLGIDVSGDMLGFARRHVEEEDGLAHWPRFVQGDFLSPALRAEAPFDAVFSMGNTMPHVADFEALREVLAYWKWCLREGGVVVLQMLNYARIRSTGNRVIAARRAGDVTTLRFYDFTEPRWRFNIVTLRGEEGALGHEMRTTELLPIEEGDVRREAARAGFEMVEVYGSVGGEGFTDSSTDLVVILK